MTLLSKFTDYIRSVYRKDVDGAWIESEIKAALEHKTIVKQTEDGREVYEIVFRDQLTQSQWITWQTACHACWEQSKEETDELLSELTDELETIVVTEGQDAGVILKDVASHTRYDKEQSCFVYINPYFSDLGEALIYLYRKMQSKMSR